jgi:hypothetical protein
LINKISKALHFTISRARARELSGSTCPLGKMAAFGSGIKRKFSFSRKNDYALDTSENLSDTSDVYQVLKFIINFHNVLFFLNLCVLCPEVLACWHVVWL